MTTTTSDATGPADSAQIQIDVPVQAETAVGKAGSADASLQITPAFYQAEPEAVIQGELWENAKNFLIAVFIYAGVSQFVVLPMCKAVNKNAAKSVAKKKSGGLSARPQAGDGGSMLRSYPAAEDGVGEVQVTVNTSQNTESIDRSMIGA